MEPQGVARNLEMRPCPQAPYGVQKATWSVDHARAAATGLRANVADVLQAWGLDPDGDQSFAVLLVLTELVTNAARHGRPRLGLIDVEMWLDGDRVVVTVMDGTTDVPVARDVGSGDESGRGLRLISAYAEAGGYEPHHRGKRVWAVICPHLAVEDDSLLLDATRLAV
ncbi:ATP-binding protein [Kitasatospora sp. NPDC057541]|uniref:ATP-binding protein n=1 Tax=unclassified Kitasatospora TaxID=2633591 RepID=UPI0036CC53BF